MLARLAVPNPDGVGFHESGEPAAVPAQRHMRRGKGFGVGQGIATVVERIEG